MIDPVSTKEAKDCIQDLQGQVDKLVKEKAALEVKLQDHLALQREVESLKRHKTQMLRLLKEDDSRKVQILDLQSQVDALKQQRAELQKQHQSIEAGLRADLAQASTAAKLVPVVKDNQAGRVEKLTVELTAAYGQRKRLKMQCEDQAVKIEKLCRLVWEMDCKTPPSYSLMRAYEHQRYILFSLVGIEGIGQQLSHNSFEQLRKIAGLDDNAQNLVAEMIFRGDILVPELVKKMFSIFGHLGYQSLKYWLNLEIQLHERQAGDKPEEPERTVRLSDFDDSTLEYAATLNGPKQVEWRELLVQFKEDLAKVAPLRQSLTYSMNERNLRKRESWVSAIISMLLQCYGFS